MATQWVVYCNPVLSCSPYIEEPCIDQSIPGTVCAQKIVDHFFCKLLWNFFCNLHYLFLFQFVTVSFWTLYNIDRNLIFPEIFDGWFPAWLNHNVHTTPLLGVLMESYLELHSFPKRSKGFGMVALFSLVYLIWVCFIAYQSGHWVYPVLAYLSLPSRTLFIIAMAMLISLIYLVGENFNKRLWGTAIYQVKQKEN